MEASSFLHGPLSAVKGALDTVRYAQAFVAHADRLPAGVHADDDERGLILQEEFVQTGEPPVVPELPVPRA